MFIFRDKIFHIDRTRVVLITKINNALITTLFHKNITFLFSYWAEKQNKSFLRELKSSK